jgi:outer membrane biosynthesis protein TonB
VKFADQRSFKISLGIHVTVLLFVLFGLPFIERKPDPEPFVMTVEVLPIGAVTNVKPSDKPIQKRKEAQAPKTTKPTPPSVKEKPVEEPTQPKDAVPLPDKPKDKPKPEKEDKPKPKDPEKQKPKENPEDLAVLLNKLKQENKTKKNAKDDSTQEENTTKSDAPYDDSLPLSISEKDAIRSQFIKCWRMPAGARDAESLIVTVAVKLSPDGEVQSAALASGQEGKYGSNPFFRAAADAALRAVHKCSPLQQLPTDKYSSWSEMELTFDPQELLF